MLNTEKNSKLIERIDKFAPSHVRRQLLVLLIAQIVFYFGSRLINLKRMHHNMALPLDHAIPVIPWTIVIYFGAFVFWAITYAIILRNDNDGRNRFFTAEISGKFVCAIIYLIIPTTLVRPEITEQGFFPGLMKLLYTIDYPDNLFPSIHCYVSWMCIIGLRGNKNVSRKFKAFIDFMSLLICLATLTTKQHLIVDVISGILLAELIWLITGMQKDPRKTFIDRDGNTVKIKDAPSGILHILYNFAAGRLLLRGLAWPKLSTLTGKLLNTRLSCLFNKPFIAHHGIDMKEYEPGPYENFNDLFSRHILPGARPIDESENVVISPCDGKVQILPIDLDAGIEIKGISYTIDSLLRDRELTRLYSGGTLMLFRLGIDNYHRYVYPVDAVAGEKVYLDGILNTVSPIAAERHPIYCENIREYTLLYTKKFGTVLMMEVGAMLVGKICNNSSAGPVKRGDEKGYFEFGASSILLIFEKGKINADPDLISNTGAGFETIVRMGERVGECTSTNN